MDNIKIFQPRLKGKKFYKKYPDRSIKRVKRIGNNKFEECVNKWHILKKSDKEKWNKKAKNHYVTGFNLFVSVCQVTKDKKKE